MQTNQTTTPLVLRMAADGDGTPLPLGLAGYAKSIEGLPVHYRRAKIARCGKWTHRGTGEQFEISAARADEWVKNTAALAAAGVTPFLPDTHVTDKAGTVNHGYVINVERDGDDVYAVLQLIGNKALEAAATRGRSVYVVNDARDAHGRVYPGESLAHVALVPNPALPDLGPTVRIAASAGGTAVDVPVLELDCGKWRTIGGGPVCLDPSSPYPSGKGKKKFNPADHLGTGSDRAAFDKLTPDQQRAVAKLREDRQFAQHLASTKTVDYPPDRWLQGRVGTLMRENPGMDTKEAHAKAIREWQQQGEGEAAKSASRTGDLSKRTDAEREADVRYLAKKPLKELRRRQELTQQQITKAHETYVNHPSSREQADRAMTNLREREADLIAAVSRKKFSLSGDSPMTEQQLDTIGEIIGADDVTDETAIDRLLAWSKAQKESAGKVTALSADVAKLTKERDDANSKALALSASAPKQPDPEVMRDRADNYNQRLDLMVDRGDMPKYVADKIKAVVKPTATLMLSAAPDLEQKRPIDFVLSLFDGAKLGIQSGNPVQRPAGSPSLKLSGDGTEDQEAMKAEAKAEAKRWQDDQLRARGYSIA